MAVLGIENPFRVYAPTGVSVGPFATGFTFLDASEVTVFVQVPNAAPELLVGGYTLTAPAAETAGGNVTLAALPHTWTAWPTGAQVVIARATIASQPYELSVAGISQAVLKKRLDALTRLNQEAKMHLGRGIKTPFGEAGPDLPRISDRAGKIAGFNDDGNWEIARTFDAFDADVESTAANAGDAAAHAQAAQSAQSGAEAARDQANESLQGAQLLYDGIAVESLAAINAMLTRYEEVSAALNARETSSLGAIDDAKADALGAITPLTTAAQAAASAAEDALADMNAFFDDNISPLPDRVTALENNLQILSFTASPAIAEVGSSVTPAFTWVLTLDAAAQQLDNGIGVISPLSARTKNAATAISTETDYVLQVSDGFTTKEATVTVPFRQKRYFGVTTQAPGQALTSAEIRANSAKTSGVTAEFDTQVERANMIVDCTGGRYPYIATPSAWGEPDFILVQGLAFSDFTVEAITLTNASGYSSSYNLLRFNGIQTGDGFTVTV